MIEAPSPYVADLSSVQYGGIYTKGILMVQWTCTVEAVNNSYAGDVEDLADRVIARLDRRDGSASFGEGRITATFTVDARLVLQATETALKTWSKALDDELAWSIVALTARRLPKD